MPHERVLKQERLNDNQPDNYSKVRTIRRKLNYDIDSTTGRLRFWCEQDGDDDSDARVDELNLDVDADTEFYLRLTNQREWHWSRDFDAITTKKDKTRYYGKVLYEKDGEFVPWDGKAPKNWRCRQIMFLASLNEDAGSETAHKFSLNIDLILPDGRELPISLDPDIQNPKVRTSVPVGGPRPGLLSSL